MYDMKNREGEIHYGTVLQEGTACRYIKQIIGSDSSGMRVVVCSLPVFTAARSTCACMCDHTICVHENPPGSYLFSDISEMLKKGCRAVFYFCGAGVVSVCRSLVRNSVEHTVRFLTVVVILAAAYFYSASTDSMWFRFSHVFDTGVKEHQKAFFCP